jgi:hypothetical protein
MKTIIAGSRDIHLAHHIAQAIAASGFPITEVVSGGATGADALGEMWAKMHNVPVRRFAANWSNLQVPNARVKMTPNRRVYNANAGYDRNLQMAEYAEALIAVWDGKSSGTRHMIETARNKGLKVYVHTV